MVEKRFTQMAIGALIAAPLSIVVYEVVQQFSGTWWALLTILLITMVSIGGMRIKDDLDILDALFIVFTFIFEFSVIENIVALMPVCIIIDITIALFAEFGIAAD